MNKIFDEGKRMDQATGLHEYGSGRLLSTILQGRSAKVGLLIDRRTGECWVEADPGEFVMVEPVDPMTALRMLRELGVIGPYLHLTLPNPDPSLEGKGVGKR